MARWSNVLVQRHADQQGQRVAAQRRVGDVVLREVEVGHGALFQVRMAADGALSEPA